MFLFALLVLIALTISGVLEIRVNWRDNTAQALDLFGHDDEKQVAKAEPFWNEGSGEAPIVPRGVPGGFADLAERVSPGVVNIQTSKTIQGMQMPHGFEEFFFGGPFGQQQHPRKVPSLGSGFVISSDGYIVTNNHVIEDVDSIKVAFIDGSEYEAEIVGRDPKTDIALIRVNAE